MAAGLGFKTFTTGEVLTADNVNGYLMQGVLVFASAAARDAAITSPQEGQCCYLKDTDAVQTYSGSAWVGFDDSNAIQNSIVDAKGDIVAASGDNTPARLAVGNNGETLVADSSTSTGLRYQPTQAAGKNAIINGGMDIWQRGTTFTGTANLTYLADRWYNSTGTTLNVTRDTDVPTSPYFQYSLKMVGTGDNSISMRIESANSIPLAGQTVTMSFYAKRTSGAGALDVRFYYPSATDNFTSVTQIGSTSVLSASPTSSWVRYQVSVAIGTNITTGLLVLINNTGASTTFITGAQLELGSVATQFSRAGGTIQGELAACQRYYWRSVTGNAYARHPGAGAFAGSTTNYHVLNCPVQMRVSPTSVDFSNLNLYDYGADRAVTNITLTSDQQSPNAANLTCTVASGGVQYRPTQLTNNNNANGYIGLSAEL